ncbi:MAG: hypothetical protein U0794_15360 [Isosphaeraceae bacterium]
MRDPGTWHRSITVAVAALATLPALADDGSSGAKPASPPALPTPVVVPGIENLHRLTPQLLSGGQPEGDAAFDALQRLGVKTIVTVDGAQPDVAAARRHGLRYVHLPIGYDGIPADQALRLVKVMNDLPGPIYVHCHHGKHRGPAAAAVCAIAREHWSREQARSWMKQAGTDPKYAGLFESVDRFVPPGLKELDAIPLAELPERAPVPDLVETMVEVDARWDRLKALPVRPYRAPEQTPGLDPAQDATLLAEAFRESARFKSAADRGSRLTAGLVSAADEADALARARRARPRQPQAVDRKTDAQHAIDRVAARCKSCHQTERDRKPRPVP